MADDKKFFFVQLEEDPVTKSMYVPNADGYKFAIEVLGEPGVEYYDKSCTRCTKSTMSKESPAGNFGATVERYIDADLRDGLNAGSVMINSQFQTKAGAAGTETFTFATEYKGETKTRRVSLDGTPTRYLTRAGTQSDTEPLSGWDGYLGLRGLGGAKTDGIYVLILEDAKGKSAIKYGYLDKWVPEIHFHEEMTTGHKSIPAGQDYVQLTGLTFKTSLTAG